MSPWDVLECATDAFVAYDSEYRILFLNQAAVRMIGRPASDLIGKSHWTEFENEPGSEFERHFRRCMTAREAVVFEAWYAPLGGWFEVRVSPAVWGGLGVWYRDISQSRRVLDAVRESEERYRQMVSALEEGVILLDAAGIIQSVNASAERILGVSSDSLVGCSPRALKRELIREDGSPLPLDEHPALYTVRTGLPLTGFIMGIRCQDDSLRWVSVNTRPVLAAGGTTPCAIVCSLTDITAKKRADAALHVSLERFQRLSESAPVAIFEIGSGSARTFVNDRWCEITGLTREEALRGEWPRALHPADAEATLRLWNVCVAAKTEFQAEFRVRRPNGEERWVRSSASPILSRSGELEGYIGAVEDITEARRTQIETAHSLELLQLLNRAHDRSELVRDLASLLQEWSGCEAIGIRLAAGDDFPYYEARGFTPEFLGLESGLACPSELHLACLCGAAIEGRCAAVLPGTTNHGSVWTNELPEFAQMGADALPGYRGYCIRAGYRSFALVPLRVSGRTLGLIQLNDRTPGRLTPDFIGFLERSSAAIAAVIEQQTTADALRDSEMRYRVISDNTADFIWLGDPLTRRFSYWSPSVARMFGYASGEFHSLTWEDILTPDSLRTAIEASARHIAALEAGDESARQLNLELEARRKDGTTFQAEASATFLTGPDGKVREIIGVAHDITEIKQAEQRRLHLEEQLVQSQKLESIGRLAGGIAHDFNNLLTVINGYADMLLDMFAPDHAVHPPAEEIRKAGQRAAELTRGLLAFSRKHAVERRPLQLNSLISDQRRIFQRLIGENIVLELSLDPALGSVMADPAQIHQVVLNLLVNARDAMPSGGSIVIATANVELAANELPAPDLAPGSYIRLTVSDSGSGVDQSIRHRIFDPFFTTKPVGEGTGLGLSIVYGIVRQSGGTIQVDASAPAGAAFHIWLPRAAAAEASGHLACSPASTLRGTETILVVEDQYEVRRLTATLLLQHGYQVLEADGGVQALDLIRSHPGPIQLVLTDVVMPGMDGQEVARQVAELRPGTAVVFVSGYSGSAPAPADCLRKPFTVSELVGRVRRTLGSSQPPLHVLITDDEPGIRRLYHRILADAGYQVTEAGDGARALELMSREKFDLVVTDLVMPEYEGIETIRDIRRLHPQQKIIAVSGAFGGAFLKPAKALGANATLAKPVSPKQFLDTIAKVLAAE